MPCSRAWPAAVALIAVAACTPSLDWRESRPAGSGVAMLFPCRPERHEREVRIAGFSSLRMQMQSCAAAGATFSLAFIDATRPDQVDRLLEALRRLAADNIAGAPEPSPFQAPGATPNALAGRLRIAGRLPDGKPVIEHAAFFVRGSRVFQATAIGASLPEEAVQTFFGAIKVAP
jgi:hypothetical protein